MPLACSSKIGSAAFGREQPHAPGLAPPGDDRLHGGHRARVALAVGGRDLGPAPPGLVAMVASMGGFKKVLHEDLGDAPTPVDVDAAGAG